MRSLGLGDVSTPPAGECLSNSDPQPLWLYVHYPMTSVKISGEMGVEKCTIYQHAVTLSLISDGIRATVYTCWKIAYFPTQQLLGPKEPFGLWPRASQTSMVALLGIMQFLNG